MRSGRGGRLAAALLVTVLPGCGFGTSGLAFTADNRLEIVAPRERDKVRLPVRIDWEVDDFEVTGPGRGSGDNEGYFAVFVDRSPVPPGRTLRHVARDDRTCRPSSGCPDDAYLEARGVHTTTATEITLETLRPPSRPGRRDFHEVTVVLLDPGGRRIGESAWHVRFEVDRGVRS